MKLTIFQKMRAKSHLLRSKSLPKVVLFNQLQENISSVFLMHNISDSTGNQIIHSGMTLIQADENDTQIVFK